MRRAAAPAAAGILVMAAIPFLAAAITALAAGTPVATGFLAVTTGSGTSQISSFKRDGSGKKQLTSGTANHYGPSLSPDGKQILFTGEDGGAFEVYRMNIDGSGVVPITKPPAAAGGASWSPDGTTIAYAGRPGPSGPYQVFRAAPDGSAPVQLTHATEGNLGLPVFSPDGKSIAYSDSRQVATAGGGSTPLSEIWVMGADGSNARALTHGPIDNYPAWSGNGSLLFARGDAAGTKSVVLAVSLAGVETPESPTDLYLTEPKPLPDLHSYGASELVGTGLGLVVVSHADGSAVADLAGPRLLAATTDSGFVLMPIPIQDGDVFSISWILGPPPAGVTKPTAVPATVKNPAPASFPWLPVLVVVVLVALGGGVYVLLRPKDDCAKEKAEVARWQARLERDQAALAAAPPGVQADILRDSIANDISALAAAQLALARCQGTVAPVTPPVPAAVTPPPPTLTPPPPPPPPPTPPTPPPPVTHTPPETPPPPPPPTKEKPKHPPHRPDPCPDGTPPKTEVACTTVVELWLLSQARIEIDGAYQAGEEDIDKALEGLESSLNVANIGTGLIGAVTDPVGSILGTLGVPSVDDATAAPTEAAMRAMKELGEKLKKLRKYGRMNVTCPRQRYRMSCVITSECQDGSWVVTDRSLTMEKMGKGSPVTMSNAPYVVGPADLSRAQQQVEAWASGHNRGEERKMRDCEKACQ